MSDHPELVKLHEREALLSQLPGGLATLLDKTFISTTARRGHIGSGSNGLPYGIGPELTLTNSYIGSDFVQELPRFLDLAETRSRMWERYDATTDRGTGRVYITWDLRTGRKIENFLTHGEKADEPTPYQDLLDDLLQLPLSRSERHKVAEQYGTVPGWVDAAVQYAELQTREGAYPAAIPSQLNAFFRGHAPSAYFTPDQEAMITADGSYNRALEAAAAGRTALAGV